MNHFEHVSRITVEMECTTTGVPGRERPVEVSKEKTSMLSWKKRQVETY
jgi:hypothetical protein